VLRASIVELRLDPAEVAADLIAMGVPKLSAACHART
jgi:hypothetical protein